MLDLVTSRHPDTGTTRYERKCPVHVLRKHANLADI
jgi:hypothetical protein